MRKRKEIEKRQKRKVWPSSYIQTAPFSKYKYTQDCSFLLSSTTVISVLFLKISRTFIFVILITFLSFDGIWGVEREILCGVLYFPFHLFLLFMLFLPDIIYTICFCFFLSSIVLVVWSLLLGLLAVLQTLFIVPRWFPPYYGPTFLEGRGGAKMQ